MSITIGSLAKIDELAGLGLQYQFLNTENDSWVDFRLSHAKFGDVLALIQRSGLRAKQAQA
jgi:hypothetical protein